MGDLRARKREIARRAIIDAAFALFSTHGFHETTVEMIAEKAVVSPRTIYRYFVSKESIVFGEFDGEADRLAEVVREHCADAVSARALFAAFAEQLGHRQNEPSFPVLAGLMRDHPQLMARGDAWRRELMSRIAEALAELRGAPEPSLEDMALAGMVVAVSAVAVADWAAHDHQDDLREVVLRAARAVLDACES